MGEGRVEGLSAVGDGGQAAISLTPDTDDTGSGSLLDSILSTLKKRSSDVWVADLISHHRRHGSTLLHSEQLLQPSCSGLHSGFVTQKLTVPPQIKTIFWPFIFCEYFPFFTYFFFLLSLHSLEYIHFCSHRYHLALSSTSRSWLLLYLLLDILGLK